MYVQGTRVDKLLTKGTLFKVNKHDDVTIHQVWSIASSLSLVDQAINRPQTC